MTINEIKIWIAKKTIEIATPCMKEGIGLTPKQQGALEILNELTDHILLTTNPHNREDIKKYNEKLKEANPN